MKIKISIPNDYNSDEDVKKAIDEIYHGDIEACESDEGRLIIEELAGIARGGGLEFVEETDYGAIWSGSKKKIKEVIDRLPRWAGWGIEGD
ncbi:MAG: hypothetical protein IPN19_12680 [Elusimicrobia bacterium]|nr:hypothetical protein [Elusimicrobiota bacterium]